MKKPESVWHRIINVQKRFTGYCIIRMDANTNAI